MCASWTNKLINGWRVEQTVFHILCDGSYCDDVGTFMMPEYCILTHKEIVNISWSICYHSLRTIFPWILSIKNIVKWIKIIFRDTKNIKRHKTLTDNRSILKDKTSNRCQGNNLRRSLSDINTQIRIGILRK